MLPVPKTNKQKPQHMQILELKKKKKPKRIANSNQPRNQ